MTTIVVAAAIIERRGRFLVTRRQAGTHLAGAWEFPGGKCEANETVAACLVRELKEELNLLAVVGEEVSVVTHDYPDRRIELHFLRCESADNPWPMLGQQMQWVPRDALDTLDFPPADQELIRLLMER